MKQFKLSRTSSLKSIDPRIENDNPNGRDPYSVDFNPPMQASNAPLAEIDAL